MTHRTTLVLDSAVYAELRERAAHQGRTLTEVIERTLRAGLARRGAPRRARFKLPSYDLGPFLIDPGKRVAQDRARDGAEDSR